MSKKICTFIEGKVRPNLHSLFHSFMERKMNEYDPYDDFDDLTYEEMAAMGLLSNLFGYGTYPSDDEEILFPMNSRSRHNRGSKSKKSDPYEDYWENEERKRSKRKGKKNGYTAKDSQYYEGSGARIIDIDTPYSGDEEDAREVALTDRMRWDNDLTIYFYPNYSNKYDRIEFNSLKEFDDFCADEGFVVPPYIAEELAYRPISHVCLNPEAKEMGKNEIYASETYGDMVYDICDVKELSQ